MFLLPVTLALAHKSNRTTTTMMNQQEEPSNVLSVSTNSSPAAHDKWECWARNYRASQNRNRAACSTALCLLSEYVDPKQEKHMLMTPPSPNRGRFNVERLRLEVMASLQREQALMHPNHFHCSGEEYDDGEYSDDYDEENTVSTAGSSAVTSHQAAINHPSRKQNRSSRSDSTGNSNNSIHNSSPNRKPRDEPSSSLFPQSVSFVHRNHTRPVGASGGTIDPPVNGGSRVTRKRQSNTITKLPPASSTATSSTTKANVSGHREVEDAERNDSLGDITETTLTRLTGSLQLTASILLEQERIWNSIMREHQAKREQDAAKKPPSGDAKDSKRPAEPSILPSQQDMDQLEEATIHADTAGVEDTDLTFTFHGRRMKIVPQTRVEKAWLQGQGVVIQCIGCDKKLITAPNVTVVYCPACGTLASTEVAKASLYPL